MPPKLYKHFVTTYDFEEAFNFIFKNSNKKVFLEGLAAFKNLKVESEKPVAQ